MFCIHDTKILNAFFHINQQQYLIFNFVMISLLYLLGHPYTKLGIGNGHMVVSLWILKISRYIFYVSLHTYYMVSERIKNKIIEFGAWRKM